MPKAVSPSQSAMPSRLAPGNRVRHPARPDWGVGQVQSVVGNRVTVNFENTGKLLINSDVIDLITIDDDNGAF
jgi:hypothetical protein